MAGADAVATGAAAANQGNAAAQTGEAAAKYNGASAEYNAPSAEYNGADAAAAGNAAITPTDDSCVSISPATNDYWCQTMCANAANCPPTMCKCGEAQASPSPLPKRAVNLFAAAAAREEQKRTDAFNAAVNLISPEDESPLESPPATAAGADAAATGAAAAN